VVIAGNTRYLQEGSLTQAQKILSLGGKIALPKFAISGTCWHGYFIDTEGNTFGIFQVDDAAK
jgi:predicted enzyme related to lactoylglutathione lyase